MNQDKVVWVPLNPALLTPEQTNVAFIAWVSGIMGKIGGAGHRAGLLWKRMAEPGGSTGMQPDIIQGAQIWLDEIPYPILISMSGMLDDTLVKYRLPPTRQNDSAYQAGKVVDQAKWWVQFPPSEWETRPPKFDLTT